MGRNLLPVKGQVTSDTGVLPVGHGGM